MHDVKALAAARDWAEQHQLDQPDVAPAVRWLADRVDELAAERDQARAELDAVRPLIDAARAWRTTLHGLGDDTSPEEDALAEAVDDLPPPSLGSPPARAQEAVCKCPPELCRCHVAPPTQIAAQPPARPAEGHRDGDSATGAHEAAETDRCEHGVSLDVECRQCLVDLYGADAVRAEQAEG